MNDVDLKVKEYVKRSAELMNECGFMSDDGRASGYIIQLELAKMVQLEELNTTKKRSKSTSNKQFSDEAYKVLEFLNEYAGKAFKPVETNLQLIQARLDEGYSDSELRQIVVKKTDQSKADKFDSTYLRPATLFGKEKCSQYAGERK